MWDTQHAVLFSQSLCMNAAELKLTLPWNEALWDAETPEEWCAINAIEQPQPQYLAVLKTYINQRGDTLTQSLNALSRVLMLHGLMSVAWDLNRRDQTSLGKSCLSSLLIDSSNKKQAFQLSVKMSHGSCAWLVPMMPGKLISISIVKRSSTLWRMEMIIGKTFRSFVLPP